jgi:Flp pilus assembly protein TadG
MPSALVCLKRFARAIGGGAAIELALVTPVLMTMTVITVDVGSAYLQQNRISSALAAGAQYAFLAETNGVAFATIEANTKQIVIGAANSLLTAGQVVVSINNGDATATDKCCITGGSGGSAIAWNCGANPLCADGSEPGAYVEISASTTFTPLFGMDKTLAGAALGSKIIERIN